MSEKAVRSPVRDILFRLVLVTLASLIIAVNMKSFVQAGDLFPGGFTGLARLTQRAAWEFWGVDIPFSPVYLLLNAVPAAISFRFVGKKNTDIREKVFQAFAQNHQPLLKLNPLQVSLEDVFMELTQSDRAAEEYAEKAKKKETEDMKDAGNL